MLLDGDDYKVAAFVPAAYSVKRADRAWEIRAAQRLRKQVFCDEQRLFAHTDRDAIDAIATPIVALSWNGGMAEQVVGTVRIHADDDGLWHGSRLAVARGFRRMAGLGRELIRVAVGSAHARGCRRFTATVQMANVAFFESLHWQTLEQVRVCGAPHALMQADLAWYPPCAPDTCAVVAPRRAAA
ncbi:N-acetyltransferase GCN5 [Salinisphaera sp. S4-8]|uniref:MSMEG_0567/Sll0786 family nitrogen starvation N-acetyltransferase n=1 Tax=Salinisphaera sp. S4-8 TaxID=633357 RepID=UPI0033411DB1